MQSLLSLLFSQKATICRVYILFVEHQLAFIWLILFIQWSSHLLGGCPSLAFNLDLCDAYLLKKLHLQRWVTETAWSEVDLFVFVLLCSMMLRHNWMYIGRKWFSRQKNDLWTYGVCQMSEEWLNNLLLWLDACCVVVAGGFFCVWQPHTYFCNEGRNV